MANNELILEDEFDHYNEEDYPISNKTLLSPIPSYNKGHQLLLKMGWEKGRGLGKYQQGQLEPVTFEPNAGTLGIGKLAHESEMLEEYILQRKSHPPQCLTSESDLIQLFSKQLNLNTSSIEEKSTRVYYCSVCNRKYLNESQLDIHLNSFEHSRIKKLSSLKTSISSKKVDRNKEERRVEKEFDRLRKASEVKSNQFETNFNPNDSTNQKKKNFNLNNHKPNHSKQVIDSFV